MNDFDITIVGAGPAGLSAALWCTELGFRTAIFEIAAKSGGQLHWIHNSIRNYPGCVALDGREFLAKFLQTIDLNATPLFLQSGINFIDTVGQIVRCDTGEEFRYRYAIIASGLRRRRLGIEGEDRFAGRGILRSGSAEAAKLAGKRVAIIGGGDAAVENALIISAVARKVYLIHRRRTFSARSEFLEEVKNRPNIEIVVPAKPLSISGSEYVEKVICENESGARFHLDVEAVLIRVGFVPNTEFLKGQVALDDNGYVRVDRRCQTSVSSVFAIGDCAAPESPTIATAVGMAATAAKNIRHLLRNLPKSGNSL